MMFKRKYIFKRTLCFLIIFACCPHLYATSHPEPTGNLSAQNTVAHVEMNMDSGTLSIEPAKIPFWKYEAQKDHKNCVSFIKQEGDKWIIESKKDKDKTGDCHVHWTIGVPMHLSKMNVNVGKVAIKITHLRVNSFTCNGGNIDLKTKDLQGTTQLNIGSGNIHMLWTKKPHPQVVEVNGGSTDMLIEAPKYTSCDISKMTHPPFTVSKTQELTHSEKADITIKGSLASGEIKTIVGH